ncbi:hypothetical protein DASC09_044420 [Saccharomycopsis crataegensis]|uniref:Protein aurora borealis n=1 Tax=Saccharomycopsis crataegensis TaxID=43959 RepID=A0AAV5QRT3_9ASCO|nr:hypothetical protein DASC09_044420 [Saccharomycopsis crataegensis]
MVSPTPKNTRLCCALDECLGFNIPDSKLVTKTGHSNYERKYSFRHQKLASLQSIVASSYYSGSEDDDISGQAMRDVDPIRIPPRNPIRWSLINQNFTPVTNPSPKVLEEDESELGSVSDILSLYNRSDDKSDNQSFQQSVISESVLQEKAKDIVFPKNDETGDCDGGLQFYESNNGGSSPSVPAEEIPIFINSNTHINETSANFLSSSTTIASDCSIDDKPNFSDISDDRSNVATTNVGITSSEETMSDQFYFTNNFHESGNDGTENTGLMWNLELPVGETDLHAAAKQRLSSEGPNKLRSNGVINHKRSNSGESQVSDITFETTISQSTAATSIFGSDDKNKRDQFLSNSIALTSPNVGMETDLKISEVGEVCYQQQQQQQQLGNPCDDGTISKQIQVDYQQNHEQGNSENSTKTLDPFESIYGFQNFNHSPLSKRKQASVDQIGYAAYVDINYESLPQAQQIKQETPNFLQNFEKNNSSFKDESRGFPNDTASSEIIASNISILRNILYEEDGYDSNNFQVSINEHLETWSSGVIGGDVAHEPMERPKYSMFGSSMKKLYHSDENRLKLKKIKLGLPNINSLNPANLKMKTLQKFPHNLKEFIITKASKY